MIQTNRLISYFEPPVAPIRDKQGRTVRPASLMPQTSLTLGQVYQLITANEPLRQLTVQVRQASDLGLAKRSLLPYVTPFGTFSRRRCENLLAFSGLLPIDVDKLESGEEAEHIKQALFSDPYLDARLVFVSPSGKGVKAFIPWPSHRLTEEDNPARLASVYTTQAMEYVRCMYELHPDSRRRGVDVSGKDVVRACYLCHDEKALISVKYE